MIKLLILSPPCRCTRFAQSHQRVPGESELASRLRLLCHTALPQELLSKWQLDRDGLIRHLMLAVLESSPTAEPTSKGLVLYDSPFKLLVQGCFYLE